MKGCCRLDGVIHKCTGSACVYAPFAVFFSFFFLHFSKCVQRFTLFHPTRLMWQVCLTGCRVTTDHKQVCIQDGGGANSFRTYGASNHNLLSGILTVQSCSSSPNAPFTTACFQHGANLHLHHYVVQQNSVQQVREVQLPVPVPVCWHECLHLRETPVSGSTGQMFGNQGK